MKITIYASDKEREHKIAGALSSGFKQHGDTVETLATQDYMQPKGDTNVAVMVGVKGKSKQIYEDHRRSGRHTLLVDKSYFARDEFYKLALDGFQSAYLNAEKRPMDRFKALGLDLKPKRGKSRYILLAGSSQKYCDWHGLGDCSEFAGSWSHTLNKLKTRHCLDNHKVVYRPKPSWAAMHGEDVRKPDGVIFSGPDEHLSDYLPRCHVLVTHGSNAAVDAMLAGVPVILISKEGASAVYSIAEHDFENMANPHFPTDEERRQLFANLAYSQFTLDEMAAGFAWGLLQQHTVKGMNSSGMSDAARTIELYKMMHRGMKAFRGGSMKGHVEAVAKLVGEYRPNTLLDYGSGKGAQYDEMRLHERWGGLKPVCYDPGYEPLAIKPKGKFDGVLSTDVAEHVPEDGIDAYLRDVIGYATVFAFFCIFTEPSRKFLPDGRNCHLTVRPVEWWLERICAVMRMRQVHEYMIRKPLPGGASQDFPHYVLRGATGPDVIVTFRGGE